MPSIRRSLIGYFLLLLGLALAAVGFLVDTFAREAVGGRQAADTHRIEGEIGDRKANALKRFDAGLQHRAEELGRELRREYVKQSFRETETGEIERFRLHMITAAFGAGAASNRLLGACLESAAMGAGPRWPSPWYWTHARAKTDAEIRATFADPNEHSGYFQFKYPYGVTRPIRGPNRGGSLPPLDVTQLNRRGDLPIFDEREIGGVRVRLGVVKVPILPIRGGPGPRRSQDPVRNAMMAVLGGAGPDAVFVTQNPDPLPTIYVQYGQPRAELDTEYRSLDQERDERLATLAYEVQRDRDNLRTRLLLIFGLTFAALAAGGWVVIGRGLTPVGRLTDAVANVSEKDFRLPVGKDELSVELLPIHDRLTHTLGALRRAFEREKQAVADISHELRTPLAGLLATIDVSLRKPRTVEQYRDTLGECRDIGKQLNRLVERILTLARIDAGQDRHRPEPTDLANLAGGCAVVVRPLAEAHGLTLTTDLAPGLTAVTDPDMLREVVMNLLSNAVEYTEAGGTIDLSVQAAGGRAVIAVRDTGIGMTPEVAGKVFERFYRADPSRHATGVHAGLGLSIVKEYVDRLGGAVAVTSRPGQGSTFTVTLPAVTARVPEPAAV